jgi:hypothetical protein
LDLAEKEGIDVDQRKQDIGPEFDPKRKKDNKNHNKDSDLSHFA